MAMRQLGIPVISGRKIPVISRIATVGTIAPQSHPMTGGGAALTTRRFFCTGQHVPPERPFPPERRSQAFLDFMNGFSHENIRLSVLIGGGLTLLVVSCDAFGFDIRRKVHKMLVKKGRIPSSDNKRKLLARKEQKCWLKANFPVDNINVVQFRLAPNQMIGCQS